MLHYCGGENACLSVIMNDPGSISHPFPLNCCFPRINISAKFLRVCKQLTLQFVIIKPIMAILTLVLHIVVTEEARDNYDIFALIVYNISYTLALYGLMLFYKATCNHPGLHNQYPILKFLSVKLVVFATYYQTVLIDIVPGIPTDSLEKFNNFLLCCEMVIFAILQCFAFSYKVFIQPDHKGMDMESGMQRRDSGYDNEPRSGAHGEEDIKNNAKDIVNVKDVAKDAYLNFSNRYGDHVLLDSEGGNTGLNYNSDEDGDNKANMQKQESEEQNPFSNHTVGFGGSKSNARVISGSFDNNAEYDVNIDLQPSSANSNTPNSATALSHNDENPFARDTFNPLRLQHQQNSFDLKDDDQKMTTVNLD